MIDWALPPDTPTDAIESSALTFGWPEVVKTPAADSAGPRRGPMDHLKRLATDPRGTIRSMIKKKAPVKTLTGNGEGGVTLRQREMLVRAAAAQGFDRDMNGRNAMRAGELGIGQTADVLLAASGEPRLPDEVFYRLRWGGLFIYVGTHEGKVRRLAEQFRPSAGFVLERPVQPLRAAPFGLRVGPLTTEGYYFAARRTHLVQGGRFTERFTYDVHLTAAPDYEHGYVVEKRVPTEDDILNRLRKKNPDAEEADLRARAHKLVHHVFPTFLTREAAMLHILQRDLPPAYRGRVPTALKVEKDRRGFVRTLWMNWLRVGGPVLSQLQFAHQAAELLTVLHEQARVIHLDLRPDNLVITERGVGFVDFGSSVRVGEQIEESAMLTSLFEQMMRTSQVQRMLGKMIDKGRVTNEAITAAHRRVDKTIDTFYLAVLIHKPHGNPQLDHLIHLDDAAPSARSLAALTAAVLRPKNPHHVRFKTAADILRGIRRIEAKHQPAAA